MTVNEQVAYQYIENVLKRTCSEIRDDTLYDDLLTALALLPALQPLPRRTTDARAQYAAEVQRADDADQLQRVDAGIDWENDGLSWSNSHE